MKDKMGITLKTNQTWGCFENKENQAEEINKEKVEEFCAKQIKPIKIQSKTPPLLTVCLVSVYSSLLPHTSQKQKSKA